MSNGKAMIIRLIVGLIKKTQYSNHIKWSEYFPKPYEAFGEDISVKLDLSDYTAKADLKSATGVYTSKLAAKTDQFKK